MLPIENLVDVYEEIMRSYFESDPYKYYHIANNNAINAFRDTLTPEQQTLFNNLLNNLSDEYGNIALIAFSKNPYYHCPDKNIV